MVIPSQEIPKPIQNPQNNMPNIPESEDYNILNQEQNDHNENANQFSQQNENLENVDEDAEVENEEKIEEIPFDPDEFSNQTLGFINVARTNPEEFARIILSEECDEEQVALAEYFRNEAEETFILEDHKLLYKCAKKMLDHLIMNEESGKEATKEEKEKYSLKRRLEESNLETTYYKEIIIIGAESPLEVVQSIFYNERNRAKFLAPSLKYVGIISGILPSDKICVIIDVIEDIVSKNNQIYTQFNNNPRIKRSKFLYKKTKNINNNVQIPMNQYMDDYESGVTFGQRQDYYPQMTHSNYEIFDQIEDSDRYGMYKSSQGFYRNPINRFNYSTETPYSPNQNVNLTYANEEIPLNNYSTQSRFYNNRTYNNRKLPESYSQQFINFKRPIYNRNNNDLFKKGKSIHLTPLKKVVYNVSSGVNTDRENRNKENYFRHYNKTTTEFCNPNLSTAQGSYVNTNSNIGLEQGNDVVKQYEFPISVSTEKEYVQDKYGQVFPVFTRKTVYRDGSILLQNIQNPNVELQEKYYEEQ